MILLKLRKAAYNKDEVLEKPSGYQTTNDRDDASVDAPCFNIMKDADDEIPTNKNPIDWRCPADNDLICLGMQLCYRPSVIVYTIILRLYGQVGKIKLAEQTFLEMLEAGCEPDEVACGTMLCNYARWGCHKDMMLFYEVVRRREALLPITVYNFMLSSLQKKTQHGKVVQLWKQMLDAGVEPNHFTYTVVICSYAKGELVEEALEAFGKMRKFRFIPEEATYSLLISLIAKHGKWDEALRLYEDMRSQGIIPSNYTCASLLTLHYKNGDYSKALSLFS